MPASRTRLDISIIRCSPLPDMRFLVDAQLPPALATFLSQRGFEAKSARDLNLSGATDTEIWRVAKAENWVVVTKDEDFAQRSIRETSGPQVLWLRIGNSLNRVLLAWLDPQLPAILRALEEGHRLVEVRR